MKWNSIELFYTLVFLIVLLLLINGCDDSGVETEVIPDYCITGKVSDWSIGNRDLHAYIRNRSGFSYSIASCIINSEGNFNLCLPASLPDSILFTSDSIFYTGCSGGNVSFNPVDVEGSDILIFKVFNGVTPVGYINRNNYSELFDGAFSVIYIWVNKNVSITGETYCDNDTLIFNGSAVSGWNKLVKNYISILPPGYTILYNNNEPSGAEWKFTSY